VDGFAVSQIRCTANSLKKIKKSTSCPRRRPHPWYCRRREERQVSHHHQRRRRRPRARSGGAPRRGGRRPAGCNPPSPSPQQLRLRREGEVGGRAPSLEEETAPPCAVVEEEGRPAMRHRWEEEAGRSSPPSPDVRMRRRLAAAHLCRRM
jgi:hypothetical protein